MGVVRAIAAHAPGGMLVHGCGVMPMRSVSVLLWIVSMQRVAMWAVDMADAAASAVEAVCSRNTESIFTAAAAVVAISIRGMDACVRTAARACGTMHMRSVAVNGGAAVTAICAICAACAKGILAAAPAIIAVTIGNVATCIRAAHYRRVCMLRVAMWRVTMRGVNVPQVATRHAAATVVAVRAEGARHVLGATSAIVAVAVAGIMASI